MLSMLAVDREWQNTTRWQHEIFDMMSNLDARDHAACSKGHMSVSEVAIPYARMLGSCKDECSPVCLSQYSTHRHERADMVTALAHGTS